MNKQLLLLAVLILIAFGADAQLFFKNNTSQPVNVAYVLPVNTGNYKGMVSHGWTTVQPNEKKLLTGFTAGAKYAYYYAVSTNGARTYGGTKNFLVDSSGSFNINDATMKYPTNPTNYWRPFRKANISASKNLIILKD